MYFDLVCVAAMVAVLVLATIILIAALSAGRADHPRLGLSKSRETFWTSFGVAIPPDEQARRFYEDGTGVPDAAWAETYWPPRYCALRAPPAPGEPAGARLLLGP